MTADSARRLPALRLLAIAAAVYAVGLVPFAYAWLTCPPDRFYTGLMFNVPDHAQYWSWVTASRDGLFISNTMTPEPNPRIFMNPMMWVLARVQIATGWDFAALFQFWRALAALALVFALDFAIRTFIEDGRQRRTAFWVALLGGGLGVIWVVVKYASRLADAPFPHDLYTAEPNTFWGLLAYPYLPLSQALIYAVMAGAWRMHTTGRPRFAALAAAAALGLALCHAYDLIPIYATLAVTGLTLWVRRRAFPARLAAAGVAVGVASGPVAFYYQRLTATDPLWQQVLAQYVNAGAWTPPHYHLVVLTGVPLVLAAVAFVARLLDDDARRLVATWLLCGLGLMYVPVVYQIKFLNGWQLPVTILAVAAWYERVVPAITQRLRWPDARRVWIATAGAVLVAMTLPTNLYLYTWRLTEMRRHDAPYFLHVDEKAALDWLASGTSPADVALAPLALGQFVPNYGATRAYVAHWAMTNRFFERRDAAERFYSSAIPPGARHALVDREGVTLFLRPVASAGEPRWDPSGDDRFERVFARPAAEVYRVRPPTAGEAVR